MSRSIERADYRVLVLHVEPAVRQVLGNLLGALCHATLVSNLRDAQLRMQKQDINLLLIGEPLPGGLAPSLAELRKVTPDIPILLLSGEADTPPPELHLAAVVNLSLLRSDVGRMHLAQLIERAALERTNTRRPQKDGTRNPKDWVIGKSAAANVLRMQLEVAARSDLNVLITGQRGTGKSRIAEIVHQSSERRRHGPLVTVEPMALSTALNTELLETRLLGQAHGTGIAQGSARAGAIAAGGTLVLDEMGELDAALQRKLLGFIDTQKTGYDGNAVPTNVRIITTTVRKLSQDVADGKLREDLLHCLDEVRIHLPPLRARADDIADLLRESVRELTNVVDVEITPDAETILRQHPWLGNVRELRSVARRLVDQGVPAQIDAAVLASVLPQHVEGPPDAELKLEQRIAAFSRRAYLDELARHNFNIRKSARELNMPYGTLRSRLRSLGILDTVRKRGSE